MKIISVSTFLIVILVSNNIFSQTKPQTTLQKTWTYTYLKAKEGQKENLREFIEQNWFAMDSIAVSQGLFNDYQLLENASGQNPAPWDFIVAVEYFTKGTYEDIKEEWLKIKANHKTILVEGKDLKDLGNIVGSNIFSPVPKEKTSTCIGNQYDLLEPFLGEWQEYLVTEEGEKLYGKLSIKLDPNTCALHKTFSGIDNKVYYKTWGYFDSQKNTWLETYTFTKGYGIYQWNKIADGFYLELKEGSSKPTYWARNKWTNITETSFQILEERSYDKGKTWKVYSTTNMIRVGY